MARILSDETTLTRKRRNLAAENRVLGALRWFEAGAAGVLLVAGVIVYLSSGSPGLLVVAGVVAFLCAGHFVKIRDNVREHRWVSAGLKGEVQVTQLLERGLPNDCYIFNDLNLKHGRRTAQIDHLVVSPRGLFVLETKRWRGLIEGDEREHRWNQVREPGAQPVRVANPVLQNARHVAALRGVLEAAGVRWPDVFSIVVMASPDAEWHVRNQTVPILRQEKVVDFMSGSTPSRTYDEKEIDAVLNLLMARR